MKYISPNTGFEYNIDHSVTVDACMKCEGSGTYHYATFADYRKLVIEQQAFDADESPYKDWDLWPTEPARSASCVCDRCKGTGIVKGEGAVHRFTMTTMSSIRIAG